MRQGYHNKDTRTLTKRQCQMGDNTRFSHLSSYVIMLSLNQAKIITLALQKYIACHVGAKLYTIIILQLFNKNLTSYTSNF